MNMEYWGLLTITIGILMFLGGATKSKFFLYQLLVKRSELLWGGKVYIFHQISGVLVIIMGIAMTVGLFNK